MPDSERNETVVQPPPGPISGVMSEGSYGRIAFEAYCAAVGGKTWDGQRIPSWDWLSGDGDQTRMAWEKAAIAVRIAHEARQEPIPPAYEGRNVL